MNVEHNAFVVACGRQEAVEFERGVQGQLAQSLRIAPKGQAAKPDKAAKNGSHFVSVVVESKLINASRLAEIVARCLPRPKPGQSHPATRSFQAIRIAVNTEFDELAEGLAAAERVLKPGGRLAVVTFHSLEDRIVKRFFQTRTVAAQGNRYAPSQDGPVPSFTPVTRRAVGPDDDELAENPRSRSAKLRVAARTEAPAHKLDLAALDVPLLRPKKGHR